MGGDGRGGGGSDSGGSGGGRTLECVLELELLHKVVVALD